MAIELKYKISDAIKSFDNNDLYSSSIQLFNILGYNTTRQNTLDFPTYEGFKDTFIDNNTKTFNETKAKTEAWKEVHLLFQLTQAELTNQGLLFDTKQVDKTVIETYLFFAIELKPDNYNRSVYSDITREINKLFPMPVMVLFKNGQQITLSIINRRLHKRDESKDVLEKITLIKDINIVEPHRGHIEILYDLSLQELYNNFQLDSFVALHNAWQKTLDANELNKKFYQELANWYFWAVTKVEFPDDVKFHADSKKDKEIRNSTNTIRLITRLIFSWFLREKGLIPDILFDERKLKNVLNSQDKSDSTYYKAILQNLFFATLNTPMNSDKPGSRQFVNGQHLVHTFYRYQRFFKNTEEAIKLFENIPFLNGGLFECLDRKINDSEIIRIDCFSENPKNEKRLSVPDELFFAGNVDIDLNEIYQTKNRKYKVRGIINILNSYKFTITENTPIEEEVALDPELLGKVFENLLASYNPETETTARKQTGSFYTPREIVNYMVDESLVAYFNTYLKDKNKTNKVDLEEQLRGLLSYTDKEHGFNQEQIKLLVEAIDKIKALDPACGSGAFPMGILHKLVFVLNKLDPTNIYWRELQKIKAIQETEEAFNLGNHDVRENRLKEINDNFENNSDDFGRKLYLIENGIYGIDIQPIAVQIAKLRFFISLIVDQRTNSELENLGIRPLPNLETKFVAGNTLFKLENENANLFTNPEIDKKKAELKQVRHDHFKARTPKTKEACRLRDKELRDELAKLLIEDHNLQPEDAKKVANWNPYDQNTFADFFDIEWMFGIKDGFDIVIGNPPYGNIFDDKLTFNYIKNRYLTAEYKIDAYSVFTERGNQLCKKDSVLTFIIPYTFLSGIYFSKFREFLFKNSLNKLIVLGKKIFQAAEVDTCIIQLKNCKHNNYIEVADFRFANALELISDFHTVPIPYNLVMNNYKELICVGTKEQIRVYNLICKDKTQLKNYLEFYHGIQSRGDEYAITSSKERNSYPLLKGRDFNRYTFDIEEKYFTYSQENIKSGGNLDFHLAPEKIIIRTTADTIIGSFDINQFLVLNSVNIGIRKTNDIDLKQILAIINSKLMKFWYDMTVQEPGKTFAEVKIVYLERIPILKSNNECTKIVSYLLQLNDNKSLIFAFFDSLINAVIYELYFPDQIKIANCEVLKYINNLPVLNNELSLDNKLQCIEKIYTELSNPEHPVSKAMYFMDTIEEIAIIEGKKK
ncbi:MAG: Eco57I restriction-modification methylase domain-containing protein [Paludibacter sp.]